MGLSQCLTCMLQLLSRLHRTIGLVQAGQKRYCVNQLLSSFSTATHRPVGIASRIENLLEVSGKKLTCARGTYSEEMNDGGFDNFTIIVHAPIGICDDTGRAPGMDHCGVVLIVVCSLEWSPVPNI